MFGNEKILKEIRALADAQDKLINLVVQRGKVIADHGERIHAAEEVLAKHGEALDLLERKMLGCNTATANCRKAVTLQQEQIDALTEKVDAMIADGGSVIWEDDRRAGIDRDAFRAEVRRMRVPYRAALHGLDDAERLCRSSDEKLTRPVRSKKCGVVRAVVVYK